MPKADAPSKRFAALVADIFEAAGRLRRLGEQAARPLGHSQARWQVLSVISDGAWTVPRIAERLGVSRQSVQRIADELCAHSLAAFEENARHARSPVLVPTKRGVRAFAEINAHARALNQQIAQAFGDAALTRFHADLRRLLHALREV